jgi:hypothetical protein
MSETLFQELDELKPNILTNDLEVACDKYILKLRPPQQVGIVLDNAGLEIFVDLCLADFFISKGLSSKVILHGKAIPWFVSDCTIYDLEWVLGQLVESKNDCLRTLGKRWKERFQKVTPTSYGRTSTTFRKNSSTERIPFGHWDMPTAKWNREHRIYTKN